MIDVVAGALVVTGAALSVLGAVGLRRFPDVFARMHAATKPSTLGLVLVLLGAAIRVVDRSDAVKLVLVAVLQLVTAPVGAHMVGRAAYRSGAELGPETTVDELADADAKAAAKAEEDAGVEEDGRG